MKTRGITPSEMMGVYDDLPERLRDIAKQHNIMSVRKGRGYVAIQDGTGQWHREPPEPVRIWTTTSTTSSAWG